MAQLSGGCEKCWHYVSPVGSDIAGAVAAAGGGVLSTFYVLMFGENSFYEKVEILVTLKICIVKNLLLLKHET